MGRVNAIDADEMTETRRGEGGVRDKANEVDVAEMVEKEIELLVGPRAGGFDWGTTTGGSGQWKQHSSIYLAVDGPASRAKVLLQRKRRRGKSASFLQLQNIACKLTSGRWGLASRQP